jgi:hypothetical protein
MSCSLLHQSLKYPFWSCTLLLSRAIFMLGSLPPPVNLPRQTLVYHFLHIGKFMRGRVGVGAESSWILPLSLKLRSRNQGEPVGVSRR